MVPVGLRTIGVGSQEKSTAKPDGGTETVREIQGDTVTGRYSYDEDGSHPSEGFSSVLIQIYKASWAKPWHQGSRNPVLSRLYCCQS